MKKSLLTTFSAILAACAVVFAGIAPAQAALPTGSGRIWVNFHDLGTGVLDQDMVTLVDADGNQYPATVVVDDPNHVPALRYENLPLGVEYTVSWTFPLGFEFNPAKPSPSAGPYRDGSPFTFTLDIAAAYNLYTTVKPKPEQPPAPVAENPSLSAAAYAGDPATCEAKPFIITKKVIGVKYTAEVTGANARPLTADADGHFTYEYGETVVVKAAGYNLLDPKEWTFEAEQAPKCESNVPATPVNVNPSELAGAKADDPATCALKPYATVTTQPGVTYSVRVVGVNARDLTVDAEGHYVYEYGETIKITASGAKLSGQTEWSYTATRAAVCDPVPVPGGSATTVTAPAGGANGIGGSGAAATVPAKLAQTGSDSTMLAGIALLAILVGGALRFTRRAVR